MLSDRTFKTMFILYFLVCVAIMGGLGYVAIHFIQKFW